MINSVHTKRLFASGTREEHHPGIELKVATVNMSSQQQDRTMRDTFKFIVTVLLILNACSPPAEQKTQTKPSPPSKQYKLPPTKNGIYSVPGICFGEGGCPWKNWRAHEKVELRERADTASSIIATIGKGEWVEPVEGTLRLIPRRGIVKTSHLALPTGDQNSTAPKLAIDDIVYLLEGQGEGDFTIWHRGKSIYWHWPEDPTEETFIAWDPAPAPGKFASTLGWWVRLKTASGQLGWVREPSFECMGPLAGDVDCKE